MSVEFKSEKDTHQLLIDGEVWLLPSEPYSVQYHLQYRRLADGQMAIGYLESESEYENPFDAEWYTIYSFNRRHSNFKTLEDIDAQRLVHPQNRHLPQILAWYGHGGEVWALRGELPAGCDCPFDSLNFAGIWLPSAACCDQIRRDVLMKMIEGRTDGQAYLQRILCRQRKPSNTALRNWLTAHGGVDVAALREAEVENAMVYARGACRTWTAYANGDVFRTRLIILDAAGELTLDEYGGTCYGSDECDREIKMWLDGFDAPTSE